MTHIKEVLNEMLNFSENNKNYSKRALILDTFDNVVKSYESRSCFNCNKYSNQDDCIIKYVQPIDASCFSCKEWEEVWQMNTRENEIEMINNEWRVTGNSFKKDDYFSKTDTFRRLKFIAKTRAIEILEYYKNEQDINQNTPFSVEDYEIALEGII